MTLTIKPLSVEIFLVDGDPEGMRTAKIPFQWTGNALVFPRKDIARALAREEAEQPGIFLLFGEGRQKHLLFVGKGGELAEHIKEQEQKEWWSNAVLFTNQEKPLAGAYLNYLQDQLRIKIQSANKVLLDNTLDTEPATLDEWRTVEMEYFLNKIIVVLSVLNFKYF